MKEEYPSFSIERASFCHLEKGAAVKSGVLKLASKVAHSPGLKEN
jgi:hypothetical protein